MKCLVMCNGDGIGWRCDHNVVLSQILLPLSLHVNPLG
jgi:hypothetical protein